jgi:hypothetical protein
MEFGVVDEALGGEWREFFARTPWLMGILGEWRGMGNGRSGTGQKLGERMGCADVLVIRRLGI